MPDSYTEIHLIINIQCSQVIFILVANKRRNLNTIDSKQAKALSIRYGQADTIYSPLSWLDSTTTQMWRIDL